MISVIIPCHNRKKNVELALTALKIQSLPKDKFEVIIVDDGSDDKTNELVDIFKNELTLKYAWINKKIAWNASRPRNFGAKLAEQETEAYLFLDSDIILNCEALQYYWEDFQKNKDRVVIGPYNWLPPQKVSPKDIEERFDDIVLGNLDRFQPPGRIGHVGQDVRMVSFDKGTPDDLYNEIYDGLACFGGNLLVPRNIFWKAGGYDEETHCGLEDGEFGIRLWKHDVNFSFDKRCLGYHVWHETPPSRFPAGLRLQIEKLNMKHFGEVNPDHGIIQKTKEMFKKMGINWEVPPEWER